MKYRRIGRSGLTVSEISYGNWLTHGSQIDEEQSVACVQAALDAGINHFDTADAHADFRGETILAKALAGTPREGVVLSTKVYYPTWPHTPNNRGLGRKHITQACNGSLRRLGTDFVDIYVLQRWDRRTPLEETFLAVADLVRQGKVLYVAVSEWTAEQIVRGAAMARELQIPFIAHAANYSMAWRVTEAQVEAACEREGIGLLAFATLGGGILTGKYVHGQPPPAGSRAADLKGGALAITPFLTEDLLERVQQLREVADDIGLTMAQLALAWVLQNPNVATATVGASRPEQIVENAKASGTTLDLATLGTIDQILGRAIERDPLRTFKH